MVVNTNKKVHQLSQAGAPYDNKYNYEKVKNVRNFNFNTLQK